MAPPTSNPFSGRRSQYLDTYANTLMAQYRVDQIRRDIQDEQSRVQYLDSLIAQARQTAAGIEAALQAQPPASLEAATALLKAQYEGQSAQRQRKAGEACSGARPPR
jgi:chromosome segregation ATPase